MSTAPVIIMNIFRSILIASLIFGLLSPLNAQQETFDAGLAAKNRGHYATAIRAWLPLAEQGNPAAQNNIGHMHEEGLGVRQSYTEAMSWYRMAADSQLAEAQHNIGLLYYRGYGVSQNVKEALRWFRLAAQQELPDAEYMIARIFHQTDGFEQDFAEALRWYARSAKRGYAESQFMYAFMLQAGEGAENGDPYRAYIWSKLAEINGLEGAQDIYSLSALMMNERQIAQADIAIQQCLSSNYQQCAD
jgi:TPR repeat protein